MSGRALLAIGCDEYDYLTQLTGAESDAVSIFELLLEPHVGDYDISRSRLLRSPTLQQARESLTEMLFSGGSLDTLTIAFAGHGVVSSGSFYMAMRDSREHALSATALSLADLFLMIAEAAPQQTYLIFDACQSGGLISDLNVILKAEVMGELGTPGVTLLATAASNEIAYEDSGHGIGTATLLECIRGDIFLQDSSAALDLIEIGRAVSERVSAAGAQTPVVWGLNLYGPSRFCKNPHAGTGDAPLRSVLVGWPNAKSSAAIRSGLPRLWEPYVGVPVRWDPRAFLDELSLLLIELKDDQDVLLNFVQRVATAFGMRAQESRDQFREIEVRAACAIALLPYSDQERVSDFLSITISSIATRVESVISEAIVAIDEHHFSLVANGLSELYYLPIRISKILGWAGFVIHARLTNLEDVEIAKTQFCELCDKIYETYSLSLVAMSDAQSPYLMSALTAASQVNLGDEAERLLAHMFSSCIECAGRVARADLDSSKVLVYLLARSNQTVDLHLDLVAQPTELLLTLLRASQIFNLTDEIDSELYQLDHVALNAYLPDDFSNFGSDRIAEGKNAIFNIGHNIWSVSDITEAWPNHPRPSSPGIAMTALLASLIFPDRTAWFLMPLPSLIEG